jgi:hypothetical protein
MEHIKEPLTMTAQDEIDRRQQELENLRRQQARCAHGWGSVTYAPRKTGGYQAEDYHFPRPGRMVWVEETTHPRWTRKCNQCGIVEQTETTKSVSRPGRIEGTTCTEQVPDFGDERRPTMRIT